MVNALSTRMFVEIHKSGNVYRQNYTASKPGPLEKGEADLDRTGSMVQFWPDPTIFETIEFDWQTIYRRIQEYAFLNKALTINLVDQRPEHVDEDGKAREVTFMYENGIADFVRHLNNTKTPIHKSVIEFEAEANDEGMALEIAMQWNESYGESVYTFANTINTHEGGTHEEGFRAALTSIVNRYGAEKKFLKSDEKLSGEDIREGLAAIISVKLANPQFEGQTKTKLGNTDMKSFVQKVANERLADWFERNPAEAKMIITKASQAARARIAAQQARKLARRKSLLESGSMPGKLADCQSTDPTRVGAVHRRGRLGRRLGQAGPGQPDPGDPADPRQDPERGEGPDRPGAEEQRGPVADHGAGHRHPRRLRRRQAALPQDRC